MESGEIMMEKVMKIGAILFFMVFFGLLFAQQTGFYKNEVQEEVELTNEQIEQFEKDIQAGKEIDVTNYIKEKTDYSTKLSKSIYQVSLKLESVVDKTLKYLFQGASKLVSDEEE